MEETRKTWRERYEDALILMNKPRTWDDRYKHLREVCEKKREEGWRILAEAVSDLSKGNMFVKVKNDRIIFYDENGKVISSSFSEVSYKFYETSYESFENFLVHEYGTMLMNHSREVSKAYAAETLNEIDTILKNAENPKFKIHFKEAQGRANICFKRCKWFEEAERKRRGNRSRSAFNTIINACFMEEVIEGGASYRRKGSAKKYNPDTEFITFEDGSRLKMTFDMAFKYFYDRHNEEYNIIQSIR